MSVKPIIFREYIGSKDGTRHKNFPSEIINKNVKEFHFILAFAKERYENKKGSGIFDASWDLIAFNDENIKNLKKDHPNARLILSIGGLKNLTLFNIDERHAWLSNATKSLTEIITHYNIDGIDINYETILSSSEDFVFCIGGLIKQLKGENIITIASIAPSQEVHLHYNLLFKADKNNIIDWVDYKFYDHFLPSKEQFIELYMKLLHEYPSVLLAGFSTNTNDAIYLSHGTFLNACQELIDTGLLHGIFVSDADYSKATAYQIEGLAQKMMVAQL